MIGNTSHGPVEHDGRNGAALPVAHGIHTGEDAAETLEDELIDETAAIVADVNDHAFLTNLREELLDEGVEAGIAHVRKVDVAYSAVGRSLDFLAIGLDPIQLAQITFVRDRLHLY